MHTIALPHHNLTQEESARIDSTRGFLCVLVFCHHFYTTYLDKEYLTHEFVHRILAKNFVAPFLLFSLSGFLIFNSFSKSEQEDSANNLKRFFLKRFFRLYPPWFFALLLYSYYRNQYDVLEFLRNLFFIFGFTPFKLGEITAFHSWTLFVEELFYVTFPVFIYFFRRNLTVHFLIFFVLVKLLFDFNFQTPPGYKFFTPFNCFHYFAYGVVAYLALPYLRKLKLSRLMFYALLALISFSAFVTMEHMKLAELYFIFWIIFIIHSPPEFSKAFNFIFNRVGVYCYSFYLLHVLCIKTSPALLKLAVSSTNLSFFQFQSLNFTLALLMALFFGALMYYLIERPSIQIGRKFIKAVFNKKTA